MMTNSKIELYLANSLEELNKRAEDNPSLQKAKSSTCAQITNVIESTWAEAKKAESNNDEERAYVLYMRLFSCFTVLKQAKDIANNQNSVQHYQKIALQWLEKADELSTSLKKRYDEKYSAKLEEERKIQAEIDEENSLQKSIDPKLLYKYLYDRKRNILLIDMRSKQNYEETHLKTDACIHVPPDLMNGKGWTPWNIEAALTDQRTLNKFKQRATYDYIILFDEDSYENNLTLGNCLLAFKQAIFLYDQDSKLKHEPLILEGGYYDWMVYYPGFSTAPLSLKKSNEDLLPFEISYPEDIVTLDEAATAVQPETVTIPQIDRTKKPAISEESSSVSVPKEIPQIPDRTMKPVPSPAPTTIEPPPKTNENPPSETPKHPKLNNINDNNRENIPPKDTPKPMIPNRESLAIYRPFNRTVPIDSTNGQYQKRFDAVTGRKIILDIQNNRYIPDMPENETTKSVSQIIPPINRETKPLLTEQTRRQMMAEYQVASDNLQIDHRTGLKNLGNSCYMNSIIQCLTYQFKLTNYFLQGEFSKDINTKNKFGSGGSVVKEWFKLVYLLTCRQYSFISPHPFKYVVGKLQHAYLGTQQQDAHEFLVFLLDSLHEDLNQALRPRIDELKSENYKNDQQFAEASKQAFQAHNKSIIIDLFYGLFKSTTICVTCSYNSIRFEAFAMISVPIPPVRQCSLDNCLDLFGEFEYLTGEERYECSSCKRLSDKKRRLNIWELPNAFIVHFKRFRLRQNQYIKNETLIRYPISNVDFSRWSHIRNPSKYSLTAVVNHYGSMNSGHYTAYCNDGHQWYYCDDHSIRTADRREIENNVHAYLLFYSSIPQQQLRLPSISN